MMKSMRPIPFIKCQGFGNDFILIEESQLLRLNIPYADFAVQICTRKFAVGADGGSSVTEAGPEEVKLAAPSAYPRAKVSFPHEAEQLFVTVKV